MNGFKQLLLTSATFASDDAAGGGAPEAGPVDNTHISISQPQGQTNQQPSEAEVPSQEAAPEPEPELALEPEKPAEPPKISRDDRRWGEIVRKLGDESRRTIALERENAELKAAREKPPEKPPEGAEDDRRYTRAEVDRMATQRAQELANAASQRQEAERTQQRLGAMGVAGAKAFSNESWTDACNTLADLGGDTKPGFLALVAELDNGHAVLHTLGNDPVLAAKVLGMSPARMGVELGRISAAAEVKPAPEPAPVPKKASQAPEPITPVGGRGTVTKTNPDDMSMDEYVKYRGYQQGYKR